MVKLNNRWDELLSGVFSTPTYQQLRRFLITEYNTYDVYPQMENIFNALRLCPPEAVKAVILGQDPYHEPGQAHGLCFSVKKGTRPPPSLVNIFKELQSDLNITPPSHGELTSWAQQGVLLLNTVLTVRRGEANSHKNKGWEQVTDRIIQEVNKLQQPVVYLLWGANARAKEPLITNPGHLVLKAPHPSPLSAFSGFFGCRHFSKVNAFLAQNNCIPIDWKIPE
jgi:uracil-DNA glycosylase